MWGERFLLEMEQFHDFWGYRSALPMTGSYIHIHLLFIYLSIYVEYLNRTVKELFFTH